MARVTLGVEVRRYVTIEVDVDSLSSNLHQIAKDAIQEGTSDLDWNDFEIDCVEVLETEDYADEFYDRAYEEKRDMSIYA